MNVELWSWPIEKFFPTSTVEEWWWLCIVGTDFHVPTVIPFVICSVSLERRPVLSIQQLKLNDLEHDDIKRQLSKYQPQGCYFYISLIPMNQNFNNHKSLNVLSTLVFFLISNGILCVTVFTNPQRELLPTMVYLSLVNSSTIPSFDILIRVLIRVERDDYDEDAS